jgi:hypothetical protein
MAQGMPRDFGDVKDVAEDFDAIPFAECQVTRRNVFLCRPEDSRASRCLELRYATDMIVVVVRDENIAQLPVAMCSQPGLYGRRITWIDHGTASPLEVLQQPYIVVGEGRECVDLYHDAGR